MRKSFRPTRAFGLLYLEERPVISLPLPKPLRFPSWVVMELDTLHGRPGGPDASLPPSLMRLMKNLKIRE